MTIREFAEMQRNRGHAYGLLRVGDRQANLRRAIACYEKALRVYTREDFPEEWADLQYDLADAHHNLPGDDRQANLQDAIACYEKALQVYTPKGEVWAMTQRRLGDAYRELPSGDRQANLEKAIRFYQAALEVYTPSDFPAVWAMLQFCLAEAFQDLPQVDRQSNLRSASTHFQSALQVYTRKAFPGEWAMTQRRLGDLSASLRYEDRPFPAGPFLSRDEHNPYAYSEATPDQDRPPPNIRDAIFYFQAALQVYTREDYPLAWASTQFALGNAFRAAAGSDRQANLEQAMSCYQGVLLVYTLESAPVEWARTQLYLGDTYRALASGGQLTRSEQAIACYEQALQVYNRQDFPAEWSTIQNNMDAMKSAQARERLGEARVLRSAGDLQVSRREQVDALESYRQALAIFRRLGRRDEEARILCRIADLQLVMDSKQRDSARQTYLQALVLFQGVGDASGEAEALRGLDRLEEAASQQKRAPGPFDENGAMDHTPPFASSYMPSAQQGYPPPAAAAPVQQPYGMPAMPQGYPPPSRPRRSLRRSIIPAVLALVIVIGGVGAFLEISSTASITANTGATATAAAASPYLPFTRLALFDHLVGGNSAWDEGSACQFTSDGYRVSSVGAGFFQMCLNTRQFGEFAYQATMNIIDGECGGLIFKYVDAANFQLFVVCQNGTYNLANRARGKWSYLYAAAMPSSAIKRGVDQLNVVAVVARGNAIAMYVNGQKIDATSRAALTRSAFSQGRFGLLASGEGKATAVIYGDVKIWTAP